MIDPKWTGTEFDRRDMRMMNLRQVVKRNFSRLAMFGFASTLLSTWEVIALSLSVAFVNGGTAGLFWNFLITTAGLSFIYASVAELGSVLPTAGGQYFWVAVLAPRSVRRFLSYLTGWLCAVAWQTATAGVAYFVGTLVQALFILNIPNYEFHAWHATLIALGYLGIAVLFNTVLASKLPMLEGVFVFCHILGIVIFIPLWIMSPRATGGAPLVDFYNPGGWSSNGVATLVGSAVPIATLTGFDCSIHMAEEARDSSRSVPVTLLVGFTTNVVLGLFALITCIYTVGPLDEALQASTGYPIVNMFYTATNSASTTIVVTVVLIVTLSAAGLACLAAASRQLWAFARNGGVPFAKFFAPDTLVYDIPLNSILFSLIIPVFIALLNLKSSAVLSIILSIYNSALLASYIITIGCILLHRLQGRRMMESRFTLGKWGTIINVIALLYLLPVFIFSFFPSTPNPTPISMNWACVMVGGVSLLSSLWYVIMGRKSYNPPEETIEDYIERANATTMSEKDEHGGLAEESGVAEESVEPLKKEV